MAGAIARPRKKEKGAPDFSGAPLFRTDVRLVPAISRPIVAIGRFALDAILELTNLVLEPSRLARLDAVARRARDSSLKVDRLIFERAAFAERDEPPRFEPADLLADAVDPHLQRAAVEGRLVAVIAVGSRRILRRSGRGHC